MEIHGLTLRSGAGRKGSIGMDEGKGMLERGNSQRGGGHGRSPDRGEEQKGFFAQLGKKRAEKRLGNISRKNGSVGPKVDLLGKCLVRSILRFALSGQPDDLAIRLDNLAHNCQDADSCSQSCAGLLRLLVDAFHVLSVDVLIRVLEIPQGVTSQSRREVLENRERNRKLTGTTERKDKRMEDQESKEACRRSSRVELGNEKRYIILKSG